MAPEAGVLVVDNASTDKTTERIRLRPQVQLIVNRENCGFAAAVNQAVRTLGEGTSILLLNPDARLRTPIGPLVEAVGSCGIAAGKLVDEDGRPQTGFSIRRFPTPAALIFELMGINRLWPHTAVNRHYRYLDRNLDQAGPVEQPAGAFLAFRRDIWEQLGGFDESFHPVWFEDVDFCKRAWNKGLRCQYVPSVEAIHQGGHSVSRISSDNRATYWAVSLLRYSYKHFGALAFRAVAGAMLLSTVPRIIVATIQEQRLAALTRYFKIFRFASHCLLWPERVRRPF